jgi:hypothetical protein
VTAQYCLLTVSTYLGIEPPDCAGVVDIFITVEIITQIFSAFKADHAIQLRKALIASQKCHRLITYLLRPFITESVAIDSPLPSQIPLPLFRLVS